MARVESIKAFRDALPRLLNEAGPHFIVLPVTNKEKLPPVNHSDHAGRIQTLRDALNVS